MCLFLALTLAGLAGCGGGASVSGRCDESARVTCERLYECFTDAEREQAGLPATEAGCVTQVQEEAGCENATPDTFCEGSETYQGGAHERCIDQIASASCNQIQNNEDFAPACDDICVVE